MGCVFYFVEIDLKEYVTKEEYENYMSDRKLTLKKEEVNPIVKEKKKQHLSL